jgi:hypothetical protein
VTRTAARYVVRAPFAFVLVATLLATTVWSRQHPAGSDAVLRWVSTNLHNLSVAPIRSMVLSALFLPDGRFLLNATLLLAAIIPLERQVGTLRALTVFGSAHVLATIITEGLVFVAIRFGAMPDAAEYQYDVGVSYGLYGVAAAALYFLPRRIRLLGVFALSCYLGVQSLIDPGLAASGHILSLGIGLCWWLVWRRWPRTA